MKILVTLGASIWRGIGNLKSDQNPELLNREDSA